MEVKDMNGFATFIVRFAYIGIALAIAGLIFFARYKRFDNETGSSSTVQKAIGIGMFALGALWVISPFFIKLATNSL